MKGNNGMLQIRPRQSNLCLPLVLACLGLAAAGGVAAAGTFDGVYRGTQRTTLTNNSGECAHIDNNNAALQIQNNHFTRVWGPANLSVDVAADGSFAAEQMVGGGRGTGAPRTVQIKGKITGGNLEADIGTNYCTAHLSLKKS